MRPAPGRVLENLSIIERAAAGMDRMIGDLLDVEQVARGQPQTLVKENVDMCTLLQGYEGPLRSRGLKQVIFHEHSCIP